MIGWLGDFFYSNIGAIGDEAWEKRVMSNLKKGDPSKGILFEHRNVRTSGTNTKYLAIENPKFSDQIGTEEYTYNGLFSYESYRVYEKYNPNEYYSTIGKKGFGYPIGRLKILQQNYPLPEKINPIPNFEISQIDLSFIDNAQVYFKKQNKFSKDQAREILYKFHGYFGHLQYKRIEGNKTADDIFNHLVMCENMIKENIGEVNYEYLFYNNNKVFEDRPVYLTQEYRNAFAINRYSVKEIQDVEEFREYVLKKVTGGIRRLNDTINAYNKLLTAKSYKDLENLRISSGLVKRFAELRFSFDVVNTYIPPEIEAEIKNKEGIRNRGLVQAFFEGDPNIYKYIKPYIANFNQLPPEVKSKAKVKQAKKTAVYQKPKDTPNKVAPMETPTVEPMKTAAPTTTVQSDNVLEYKLSKHTKTGEDLHTVKMLKNLSRDQFLELKKKAKAKDGYYSKYAKAFIFNTKADALQFAGVPESKSMPMPMPTPIVTATPKAKGKNYQEAVKIGKDNYVLDLGFVKLKHRENFGYNVKNGKKIIQLNNSIFLKSDILKSPSKYDIDNVIEKLDIDFVDVDFEYLDAAVNLIDNDFPNEFKYLINELLKKGTLTASDLMFFNKKPEFSNDNTDKENIEIFNNWIGDKYQISQSVRTKFFELIKIRLLKNSLSLNIVYFQSTLNQYKQLIDKLLNKDVKIESEEVTTVIKAAPKTAPITKEKPKAVFKPKAKPKAAPKAKAKAIRMKRSSQNRQTIYKKADIKRLFNETLTECNDGTVSTSGSCNWHGGVKGKYQFTKGNFKECDYLGYQYANSVLVPLGEIKTREDVFQNRTTAFSSKSSKKIQEAVKNKVFKWELFDPIILWVDAAGELGTKNQIYVLSGHSRFAAFKVLAKEYTNFRKIPAKILKDITLEEAVDVALNSNTLATPETEVERSTYFARLRENGIDEKTIEKKLKNTEGANWKNIYAYSFLNPNGKAINMLSLMQESDDDSLNKARSIANWIGITRSVYPQLTNAHEDEMYDFLFGGAFDTYRRRNDWLDKVDDVVRRLSFMGEFDSSKPLNLRNLGGQSSVELEYNKQLSIQQKKVSEMQRDRNSKLKQLKNQGANQQEINRIISPIDDTIRYQQVKLQELIQQKSKVREAAKNQGNLFAGIGRVRYHKVSNMQNYMF